MKRILLFSTPTANNTNEIINLLFPAEFKRKIFSYMPSDGTNCPQKYIDQWEQYSLEHDAEFQIIDNSHENDLPQQQKLLSSNILIITGGNTYQLLQNLRRSGLDSTIQQFIQKDEFVLAGFSAGAIVLTPTISICTLPDYDQNLVGLKDLTGLNIVNFEVYPHYSEEKHKQFLQDYQNRAQHPVRTITDDKYLVLER